MKQTALGLLLLCALVVAGCGSASDSTVASCLKNTLANQVTGSGHNCNDPIGSKVLSSGSGTRLSVTCTHKNGNEYTCDVTGPAAQSVINGGTGIIQGGFYDVTFDGQRIVYQPSGG